MTDDPAVFDARTMDVSGLWINPTGSELELCAHDATVTGFYRTAVGAARLGSSYPLVGWRDRRCLGFTVSWGPDSESLTSWTGLIGQSAEGEPLLSTMWLLVSATAIGRDGEAAIVRDTSPWEAFRTYTSVFRRRSDAPARSG